MYTQVLDPLTKNPSLSCIRRDSDGALIPFDPENSDCRKYLAWIAQGNTPNFMTILSAKYANEIGDAVEAQTEEGGAVMICLPPHSDNVVGGQDAYAAWHDIEGNITTAYVAPTPDPIALAQSWVARFFDAVQLLKMFKWTLEGKTSAKLAAALTWEETISAQAGAGATTFPDAPFTFSEVATEVLTQ